ncbi:hypothetical protein [Solitalea canadensis]|uniref:Lipocalin-like domain-containing protein n=1 Tax=Solitalea canadensis (strain ATCC 29591 / DSM 3403 / JCM 21819 / LMG 8368 / NBRC 15130 / NCIMB 12057 / USAM 9D) TaxID=929556 RepID=H8KQ48_SOLCM|nr:hypothetical protein [Solitalea canadensis]AFD06216.1 hypothetical protein Solca_1110 [Solitalea canadensis DSM 3403]
MFCPSIATIKVNLIGWLLCVLFSCNNHSSLQDTHNESQRSEWCGTYVGVITEERGLVRIKLKLRSNGYYTMEQKDVKVNANCIITSYVWKVVDSNKTVHLYKTDDTELSRISYIDSSKIEISFNKDDKRYFLYKKP